MSASTEWEREWRRLAREIAGQIKAGKLSMWEELAAALARHIDSGRIPAGTRLPGRATIAADVAVSVSTVTRALGALKFSGRTRGQQGKAVFVVGPVATPPPGPGQGDAPTM